MLVPALPLTSVRHDLLINIPSSSPQGECLAQFLQLFEKQVVVQSLLDIATSYLTALNQGIRHRSIDSFSLSYIAFVVMIEPHYLPGKISLDNSLDLLKGLLFCHDYKTLSNMLILESVSGASVFCALDGTIQPFSQAWPSFHLFLISKSAVFFDQMQGLLRLLSKMKSYLNATISFERTLEGSIGLLLDKLEELLWSLTISVRLMR
jgi:hypothetical protein